MDRSLRILYNCIPHGVLEYDELRVLSFAGHKVYSLGDYWNRNATLSDVRRANPEFYDDRLTALYLADPGCDYRTRSVSSAFCSEFDVVLASGPEAWMHQNFSSFGNLPVIFRTIGQSNLASEQLLAHYGDRITVVRYSSAERDLPGFARTDAIVYFGKDPADFPVWEGGDPPVTFHSHYRTRDAISAPRFAEYEELAGSFDARLYGGNEPDGGHIKGPLHYEDQFRALAKAGCYIYVWSQPPSYTLSLIEAMMVGLPVVAPSMTFLGRNPPEALYGWVPSRYEVQALLGDGCGFVYDTVEQGQQQIWSLLSDPALARSISEKSRNRARATFAIARVAEQWNTVLSTFS